MKSPLVTKIAQAFDGAHLADIEGAVRAELSASGVCVRKDQSVALAVGSRGIANISRIVKATADWLRKAGAQAFIVPAMGSHGGATAQGQRQVLAGYGITEETMGVPVKSSMEVAELPRGDLIHPLYMDKNAWGADGVVVINRVKQHTDFHGVTESGMLKMCVIGLGKHRQALVMHSYGVYGLKELIPKAARQVLRTGKVILGLGIVENAYDQTAVIQAALPERMEEVEIELLARARKNMPRFPVDRFDVLIVDEMGKNISGVGMDSNITGRMRIRGAQDGPVPDISCIVACDLTDESHGNALGMGAADFITKKLADKINFQATYENVMTSAFPERGKMPVVAQTDRQALAYALRTCGKKEDGDARIIRIKNTLRLDELYVSSSILREIEGKDGVRQAGPFDHLFEEDGALKPF